MKQGIKEHLDVRENYTRLSPEEATEELAEQKKLFLKAFKKYSSWLTEEHEKYFIRSFKKHSCFDGSRTSLLYLLWKVHKQKSSTGPVISSCGPFSKIFSVYVDEMLKWLVQDVLLSYLISSDQLVCILSQEFPAALPFGAMFFSIDAVGMYSNIDTEHGIKIIREFILRYAIEITELNIPVDFVVACLEVIMKRNIFQFGDTFWR